MSEQPEALRLADELVAPVGTQSTYSVMQQAAAELRRLHALVMDKQGEIYGLTFARETERKIHGLVKVECGALRARADALQRWHDQQLDRSEKAEAECDALRAAWSEILSGHCPSKYPMTDKGLLDYHRDLARAALKVAK